MSHRAKLKMGTCNPDRWMAEVFYRDATPTLILKFEELKTSTRSSSTAPIGTRSTAASSRSTRWPLYEGDSQ
jgi:hypothetical protein